MSYPKDELPAPEPVRDDPQAFELLRLWFALGAPRVAARLDLWPDPAAWGFMLGEVARDLARGCAEQTDVDPAVTLERIRAGFVAEVEANDGAAESDAGPWGTHPGSGAE